MKPLEIKDNQSENSKHLQTVKKKILKQGDRLFSECKREHYIFAGCDGDHISLVPCDHEGNITGRLTIRGVREFGGEFLHKSPCDEKNVYNLIDGDGTLNFTTDSRSTIVKSFIS